MPTEQEIEAFDKVDPTLIYKRILPDGRCLRLSRGVCNLRITIAEDAGADWFDLVYDYDLADVPEVAAAVATTWDGTGEPVGYVRRMPPLFDACSDDEETLTGARR